MTIKLANGTKFDDPEGRIREYCEIEVYRDIGFAGGYDDHHSVNDIISNEDVEAANNLYALLTALDGARITKNPKIPELLEKVRDVELGDLTDSEWKEVKSAIGPLLSEFLSIPNVKLAKATKVLHLKRPHLLPILDSFVVGFLTGTDTANLFSEDEWLQIAMTALDVAKTDIVRNHEAFKELNGRLADLPTPLTTVRVYGILCWTQEKWVNLGNTGAKHGVAIKSLEQNIQHPTPAQPPELHAVADEIRPENVEHPGEITSTKEFRRIVAGAEGVIVVMGGAHPIAHSPLCSLVSDDRFSRDYVLGRRRGMYYWRASAVDAKKEFGASPCKRCLPGGLTKPAPKW